MWNKDGKTELNLSISNASRDVNIAKIYEMKVSGKNETFSEACRAGNIAMVIRF